MWPLCRPPARGGPTILSVLAEKRRRRVGPPLAGGLEVALAGGREGALAGGLEVALAGGLCVGRRRSARWLTGPAAGYQYPAVSTAGERVVLPSWTFQIWLPRVASSA